MGFFVDLSIEVGRLYRPDLKYNVINLSSSFIDKLCKFECGIELQW